jgi:hypothetical protein
MLAADSSLPTWGVVLIALGSSAVGGALGSVWTTWRQIKHEEAETLRSRMFDAADDFAAGISQAELALQEAVNPRTEATMGEHFTKGAAETRRRVEEAWARLPRVVLLFGEGSLAGLAARAAAEAQGAALVQLESLTDESTEIEELEATVHFQNGRVYLARFVTQARLATRNPLKVADASPEEREKFDLRGDEPRVFLDGDHEEAAIEEEEKEQD